MSRINQKQVEHIAKLARIELTKKEKEKFKKELSLILDYVGKLNKVNTEKIEIAGQITGLENIVREDVAIEGKGKRTSTSSNKIDQIRSKILRQAPKKNENYFQVPKILE